MYVQQGNDDSSPEEALVVSDLITELMEQRWQAEDREVDVIGLDGVLVVTPFNAHVHEIELLSRRGKSPARA